MTRLPPTVTVYITECVGERCPPITHAVRLDIPSWRAVYTHRWVTGHRVQSEAAELVVYVPRVGDLPGGCQ